MTLSQAPGRDPVAEGMTMIPWIGRGHDPAAQAVSMTPSGRA